MFDADWRTLGIIFTVISAVSSLTWWLSGQFGLIRNLVFERVSMVEKAIVEKLEYHERHDDERFGQIRNDISELRVRNASKDTMMTAILTRLEKIK